MRRATVASILVLLFGCGPRGPAPRTPTEAQLFAPVSMRIHPIFTQVKDWDGDGQPDGIEALLEFQDQFADPTKAAGTAIFELYGYRRDTPDSRGGRVVNPWVGPLQTLVEQQARWNRTSRTYFFQLEYPGIHTGDNYVLAATFDTGTTRFFDQMVLEGDRTPRSGGTASPAPLTPPAPTTTRAPLRPATTAPTTTAPAAARKADVTARP